jgi:hypothetical protein
MPTGGGAPKPGPVTSVPTGITCGGSFISGSNNGDCEESYTNGTSVVLTAQGKQRRELHRVDRGLQRHESGHHRGDG